MVFLLDEGNSTTSYNGEANLDEEVYAPYSERPETYILPVVFACIFIVGVLGNGTLVIIFLRHRAMRNMPNTYILSLALADLLVIFICVPLASLVYTLESWPWGGTLCRITEFAKDISIGVSVFTLTALSAERYRAIVNPLRKLQTRPLTVFTAAMIWLLAILFATPAVIVSDAVPQLLDNITNHTIIICTPFGPDRPGREQYTRYVVVAKAFIYYILPLFIIGALYILMAKRLHVSAREMPGELSGPQSRTQARARRHVARMVVTFVVVFFACFFPLHFFELWFHLNPNALDEYDEFWHVVRIVGFCTSFLNSCVNPVALYCISGVFRQHFHRYLCCRPIVPTLRLGQHSSALGTCDTSFTSVRRATTTTLYNHSIHRSSNPLSSSTTASSYNYQNNINLQRQQSIQLMRDKGISILSKNNHNHRNNHHQEQNHHHHQHLNQNSTDVGSVETKEIHVNGEYEKSTITEMEIPANGDTNKNRAGNNDCNKIKMDTQIMESSLDEDINPNKER